MEAQFRDVVEAQNSLLYRQGFYGEGLAKTEAEFRNLVIELNDERFEKNCKLLVWQIDKYHEVLQEDLETLKRVEESLAELKAKYPQYAEEFIAKYSEHVA